MIFDNFKNKQLSNIIRNIWIKPEGFNTNIKIYNCITKQKEPLIVKNKDYVTWYTCGPTVYDSTHLGHASCFIKLDIIQRILKKYFQLNIIHVMNITDIDDKIINKSKELNINYIDLTKKYETEFWRDLKSLGINKPNIILRVTDSINIIIQFIEKLIKKDFAYKTNDGSVYFDTIKYQNYGKLFNIENNNSIDTCSNEMKKSINDFVLWKNRKTNDEPYWNSPWGQGRPGWHIECSSLASYIFDNQIDFHCGGIDLKFPHHENEEAQSCCYHSVNQWVNYWIHTGHLHLKNSEKMSKSLGNIITVEEIVAKNKCQQFRMACLMSNYRSKMEFNNELLETAENLLKNYRNFLDNCNNYILGKLSMNVDKNSMIQLLNESRKQIDQELCNDFNTPGIINILNNIISNFNSSISNKNSTYYPGVISALSNLFSSTINLFGLETSTSNKSSSEYVEVMDILSDFRQQIRTYAINNKDKDIIKLCDNVRNNLRLQGIIIKDLGKTSSWSR